MVSTCNCCHTSTDPINIRVGSKSCSRTSSGMLLHVDGWHFPIQILMQITFTNTRIELYIICRKQCIRLVLVHLYMVQPIQTMLSFQRQLFQRSQPHQPITHWQHVSASATNNKHTLIAWKKTRHFLYAYAKHRSLNDVIFVSNAAYNWMLRVLCKWIREINATQWNCYWKYMKWRSLFFAVIWTWPDKR